MNYILPALFGFITGCVTGFTITYLMPGTFSTVLAQTIGGIVVGAIFGGLIGSISGELNATGDTGTHKLLVAILFGALGGFFAATKLEVIWVFFRYMHWRVPV